MSDYGRWERYGAGHYCRHGFHAIKRGSQWVVKYGGDVVSVHPTLADCKEWVGQS